MKLSDVRRFTPAHWILIAVTGVCAVVAFFIVIGGLGFRWDPLDLADKRADRAETAAATAKVDAGARSAEADGARATTRIVEKAAADRSAASDVVHRYATQLEATAHEPTPVPDDGSDLRVVVDELCGLRPSVCAGEGHAAAPRNAGDGPSVVPDSGAAG